MSTEPLDELKADVHAIKAMLTHALYGDPGNNQPGVYIRIDRLEQQARQLIWLAGAALTASLGAIAGLVANHLHF